MKTLLDYVLQWEKEHGIAVGDKYLPYFDDAKKIARRLGLKPLGSTNLSSFNVFYTPAESELIISELRVHG
jgi:hypothetical protein